MCRTSYLVRYIDSIKCYLSTIHHLVCQVALSGHPLFLCQSLVIENCAPQLTQVVHDLLNRWNLYFKLLVCLTI